MMSAVFAAMNSPNSMEELAKIGPYKSRGKGRNKPFIKSCLSRAANHTGHTYPHDSDRERERRQRQAFAREVKAWKGLAFKGVSE